MQSSDIILEAANVCLSFTNKTYNNNTWRDQFINLLRKNKTQEVHALKDISFTVNKNDVLGVLGKNGAGKSTLCRCIAGLYQPDKGSIKVNGRIHAIFDLTAAVYSELTGRENAHVLFCLLYPFLEKREKIEVFEEAMRFSELKNDLDRPIKYYSNGMLSRLALSLITAIPAELLILDEVYNGADKFFKEKITTRINKQINQSKATIVISHSNELIKSLCNRSIVVDRGEIVFDGSPTEAINVYDKINNYENKNQIKYE